MRGWMVLWVIEDGEIPLQVGGLECGLRGQRMILSKTNHDFVAPQFLDVEIRMRDRESDDCGIDHSFHNFFDQMARISMRRPYRASGKKLFVKSAEAAE